MGHGGVCNSVGAGYDYHIPSKEYVTTCSQGYNDFDFDINILNQALQDTIDSLPKKLTKK